MKDSQQSGFILLSVIWLTLFMFVLAGIFSVFANAHLQKAVAAKSRLANTLEQLATEQSLLYLMSTRSADRFGLLLSGDDVVKLDGRFYAAFSRTSFSVNDEAGLIGVNAASSHHLSNLLETFDSSRIIRRSLTRRLLDYTDYNDEARLGGAEAPAYRVAGIPQPTNDYLVTVTELLRVYGWSEWLNSYPHFNVDDWLSTNWRSRLNINTAPESLLLHALPLRQADREAVIERRRGKPFRDMTDLNASLNLRAILDEDYYTFLPSPNYRFRIYSSDSRKILALSVRATPLDTRHPWIVNYRYQYEIENPVAETTRRAPGGFFDWELSAAEDFR